MALGLKTCLYIPQTDHDEPSAANVAERLSEGVCLSSPVQDRHQPPTPTSPSSGILLSRSGRKSSKVCSFCRPFLAAPRRFLLLRRCCLFLLWGLFALRLTMNLLQITDCRSSTSTLCQSSGSDNFPKFDIKRIVFSGLKLSLWN